MASLTSSAAIESRIASLAAQSASFTRISEIMRGDASDESGAIASIERQQRRCEEEVEEAKERVKKLKRMHVLTKSLEDSKPQAISRTLRALSDARDELKALKTRASNLEMCRLTMINNTKWMQVATEAMKILEATALKDDEDDDDDALQGAMLGVVAFAMLQHQNDMALLAVMW